MAGNIGKAVFTYGLNSSVGLSNLTGQTVSHVTNNQSGLSTATGVTATVVGYSEGVASAASYAQSGKAYTGKLAGAGTLIGIAQVAVNIYENNGDTSKLTAGDLLNIKESCR